MHVETLYKAYQDAGAEAGNRAPDWMLLSTSERTQWTIFATKVQPLIAESLRSAARAEIIEV